MPDTDITLPKFGDVLPNGATVVQYVAITPTWGIVLAHTGSTHEPWVTWGMSPERLDSTTGGSYKATLNEAVAELAERSETS